MLLWDPTACCRPTCTSIEADRRGRGRVLDEASYLVRALPLKGCCCCCCDRYGVQATARSRRSKPNPTLSANARRHPENAGRFLTALSEAYRHCRERELTVIEPSAYFRERDWSGVRPRMPPSQATTRPEPNPTSIQPVQPLSALPPTASPHRTTS